MQSDVQTSALDALFIWKDLFIEADFTVCTLQIKSRLYVYCMIVK